MEDRKLFEEIRGAICSGKDPEEAAAYTEGFIEALRWLADIHGKRGELVRYAGALKLSEDEQNKK